ncbi:MAG: NUDIX domain-containing protein [Rhodospirillales bacterium]|nr:NUDIX domain-containing protein [Rhodospirillales bacterium]
MTKKFDTPSFSADAVEVLEKDTPFKGYFQIDHYNLRHKFFDGGWSPTVSREIFERGHVVAVVPYDPVRDELVLIEQFRPGAYAAGWEPWLIEIVAGIIEPNEDLEEVARRETVEETGLEVKELELLGRYLSSPGGSTESVETYCAKIDATNAEGIHGLQDEGEDIRVVNVLASDAFELLDNGRITNGMTLIGLEWFRKRHQEFRTNWK